MTCPVCNKNIDTDSLEAQKLTIEIHQIFHKLENEARNRLVRSKV